MAVVSIENLVDGKRLGKAPARSHMNTLHFGNYVPKAAPPPPKVFRYWGKKKPIKIRDMGNNEFGNCTIASQVIYATKRERIEQRRTILIPKDEIVRVYFNMSDRLYGGGDGGAYEMDALNNWRNKDYTFRDTKGNPYTIDAYTRLNHSNIEELKRAIVLSDGKGIKICFRMPIAWANTLTWDIPENTRPIGQYLPSSWGDHSMCAALDYDEEWLYLDHTWNVPTGRVSWRAVAIYADEAHQVIDSVNTWGKRIKKTDFNLPALISDVNSVSDVKIK